ncbi:MAG: lamin tail domain-containing protein, partial [Tenericutes bacterium]|nr:lamin tail domain-containing protein [Mycoplasmatota bacterium]
MKFDTKLFKKNISFFIISALILVLLCLISLLTGGGGVKLNKVDLNDDQTTVSKLVISEIMSLNKGALADPKGKLYDYIELYNGNEKDINLKNYGLSDEINNVKWVFPEVIIEAKSYLVVFLSGSKQEGLYATFKLKANGGETFGLFKPNGKVVDAIKTVALEGNTVMARDADGKWVIQTKPTPGFANNLKGHEEFLESIMSDDEKSVIITE